MKICPNTAVKTHPLLQNITALTLNIQHICIFLSQPEETQKYKKTYWLVKSTKKGCNLTATPSIYTIFDNNLKGNFIFLHHFNSKGTVPFTSAAEAAMTASNLPGSATQACWVSSKKLRASLSMVNVTSFVSPGASFTFWKPFSSLTGRGREDFLSLMYSWTTSCPSRAPVFFTETFTVSVPSACMVLLLSLIHISEPTRPY